MPEPRTLVKGLVFGESPRWHDGRRHGFTMAADAPAARRVAADRGRSR